MSNSAELVYKARTLEELFDVLSGPEAPKLPHGGWVRLHPDHLPEPGLRDYVQARARAELFGLRLVVTPKAGVGQIELRRRRGSLRSGKMVAQGD